MVVEAHQKLTRLLEEFHGGEVREQEMARQTRELLRDVPRCAFRDHFDPGHLTASAWVVNKPGDKVVLVRHRKLQKWVQPGGHADGDLDLIGVARRETQEETGLSELVVPYERIFDIDVHNIPAWGAEPEHLHFDVRFLIVADDTQPLVVSDESAAVQWVALDKISEFSTEESIRRMYRRWDAWNR